MPFRNLINYDINILNRDLEPTARGMLRVDVPNFWKDDSHALTRLSYSPLLGLSKFDALHEDNKYIVAALVKRIMQVFRERYLRKETPRHLNRTFLSNFPILYVISEELWQEILNLAEKPGADGGYVTDPASRDLTDFVNAKKESGEIVQGSNFEEFMDFAQHYLEDPIGFETRHPVFNTSNLDTDDMHAFLCAYDTAFSSS